MQVEGNPWVVVEQEIKQEKEGIEKICMLKKWFLLQSQPVAFRKIPWLLIKLLLLFRFSFYTLASL